MTTRRILFATDLSARCDRALDRAARLAQEWQARLLVVHALAGRDPLSEDPPWRRSREALQRTRECVREDLGAYAHLDPEVVVEPGEPVALIQASAARFGCELIVTGVARDESLGRFFLGTTVNELARKSDVPVLVVKSRPRDAYRHVIVATDFSEGSRSALERTLELLPEAAITLFHAFDIPYEQLRNDQLAARDAGKVLALNETEHFISASPAATAARARIHPVCEYGEPGALLRELLDTSKAQLVAFGTAGRTGIASVLLGSVALRLAAESPVDVLLVRRRREPAVE